MTSQCRVNQERGLTTRVSETPKQPVRIINDSSEFEIREQTSFVSSEAGETSLHQTHSECKAVREAMKTRSVP